MGDPRRLSPRTLATALAVGLLPALAAHAARAQTAEEFFRGKQINFVIGYNPGGSYDIYSNLAAKALPRFIPGAPTITPRYMPGVGGLKAASFLMSQGSRDGLTIGMVSQTLALKQALRDPVVEYDANAFGWIGRLSPSVEVTIASRASGVRTLEDARKREVLLGATSAGSTTDVMPRLMNLYTGTKFKIVKGYPGTTGAALAMERGEVDGAHETVDSLVFGKPDWVRDGLVSVLVQYALRRHPAFPDAPAMVEAATNESDRALLELFGGTADIGRAILTPPGVPDDRLAILRRAFDAMAADPEFRAEVARRNLDLVPLRGVEVQGLVAKALRAPPDVTKKALEISMQ